MFLLFFLPLLLLILYIIIFVIIAMKATFITNFIIIIAIITVVTYKHLVRVVSNDACNTVSDKCCFTSTRKSVAYFLLKHT